MTTERDTPRLFADLSLARRIERTEALGSSAYVDARAHVFPDRGARWIEVGGTYAMFDGVGSPITQTFGLGMFSEVTDADMDGLEAFFRERGAAVDHEVSPLADPSALARLVERGYRPIEFTSNVYRELGRDTSLSGRRDDAVKVRIVDGDADHAAWAETAARGWGHLPELGDFLRDLATIGAHVTCQVRFLAELDGEPVAAGALNVHDDVAFLAGASTVPEARNRGAQLALLDARLRYAVERGCEFAMMGAAPGSASQRNAERQGFRIAYTRVKWHLD